MDGFVIECTQRTETDLKGRDYRTYLNRKGFYAWVSLAIVDAYCEFTMFEINWPGATNDCTTFDESEATRWMDFLYTLDLTLKLGLWVAADDAFSASHKRVLTPFTKSQLRKARLKDPALYRQMRTFNHILSQQRITVERAFGILVRRWGCLWSAFERYERKSLRMIIVCVKLHNICVRRWKIRNVSPGSYTTSDPSADVPEHADAVSPLHFGGQIQPDAIELDDDTIKERLLNQYKDTGVPKQAQNTIHRLLFCNRISDAGVSIVADDDFLDGTD
jgi:hypothetical protein